MEPIKFKVGDVVATDYYGSPKAYTITRLTASTAFGKGMKMRVTHDDGYGQNGTCVPDSIREGAEEVRLGIIRNDYIKGKGKYGDCLFPYSGRDLHYYTD